MGWFAAIVVGIIGRLAVLLLPHNLRVRRVRRDYRRLPKDLIDKVLGLVEATASSGPAVTFLRLDEEQRCDGALQVQSHVGGLPYAEAGDEWPTRADQDRPPRFLLQVRLDEPGLGPAWQGRLVEVFFIFDAEQIVRTYASPAPDRYVSLTSPEPPFQCVLLTPLRMPVESDEERLPALPKRLCELVPAINEHLTAYTKDCAGVLTQILRPGLHGYDLDAPDIAYVGGEPMLIQNPHDAICDQCGRPMRFLFQFGEVIPGLQMADAGVGYVYGCDDHPDCCKCYIDSH